MMTTTTNKNIMSAMLDRATSREAVDELATQMFVLVVSKDNQMIQNAQEMLIEKIRSHDVAVSTRAVAVLEECMTKCGTEFQEEIAKFRFLNELIRLVSKKYLGDSTPFPIKQRIMECLLLWTTEFPQRTKIREAYEMLTKEGAVEHGTTPASVVKRESVLGIDEDMLSKLIKSGDPENFKRANLLIQHRVNQEARRTELLMQQKSELQEVQSTVSLLGQMLDAYEAEGREDTEESETMNLIRELYLACKNHKTIVQRLPELIGNTEESLLTDALETNDALQAVIKRYKEVIVHPPSKVNATNSVPAQDLLSELLGAHKITLDPIKPKHTEIVPKSPAAQPKSSSTFDDLSAIFGNVERNKAGDAPTAELKYPEKLFDNLDILQPVNCFSNNETEKLAANKDQPEKRAFRELREIDKMSEELFKENMLSERIVSFKKKEPEKLTLNELAKEKTQNIKPALSNKEIKETSRKTSLKSLDDDEILSATSTNNLETMQAKEPIEPVEENSTPVTIENGSKPAVKHLSEISVDLDGLTPCGKERVLLEDEDVKVTLNFTEDRPSKHVSVIVIAVANKSKESLKEFHFEASVKKPCKLRLLPPTDTGLPPFKQYRPPTPINQVLLLLNPTGKEIDVTCILGYKLGDDPDPIKESLIAKAIPYFE